MNVQTKIAATPAAKSAQERVAAYDWSELASELDQVGAAVVPKLLSPRECRAVAALYPLKEHFRSHIVMARHGFGKGEYRYFKYPLPDLIGELRTALYPRLAPIANAWNERMAIDTRYPHTHRQFLELCHKADQERPGRGVGRPRRRYPPRFWARHTGFGF